ncbi:hypothetical protein [Haloplanus rubicundus]|uniref:hypothetical protein n=1 Tax=Haloplanus rubicundus TaxID=1547898 RepID=UPI001651314F|nr:hypothetical protein [Haloplanus rubicundus]
MSDRTDRLLALHVILMALFVVSQTTVVLRNQLLGSIGIVLGTLAIIYALVELINAF